MNVLFVGHEDQLNGASKCMLEIIDVLLQKDYNIYVLTSYCTGDFYNELSLRAVHIIYYDFHRWIIERKGSSLHWFLTGMKYKILLFSDLFGYHRLCSEIKKYQIDIIHSNTSVVHIGALLAEKLHIPHVWHLREFGKEDFNMIPVFGERYTWHYMQTHADRFIAISKSIRNKYDELLGTQKIKVIYDGVTVPNIRKTRKLEPNEINLLIAGRVSEAKGQREAVEMLISLYKKGYSNFKLYIAGTGDIDSIRTIDGFDLVKEQVYFCGYVRDMNELRRKMDIELVCSRSEGFGRVTIEAMMMGNPVVGARTGATAELVIDGVNGFTYEKGNIDDFTNQIIKLVYESEYRVISENSFKFARDNFTIQRNVDDIEKIYTELVLSR